MLLTMARLVSRSPKRTQRPTPRSNGADVARRISTYWFRHSYFMVLTNRSACGLQLGLCAGIFTLFTPAALRIALVVRFRTDTA